MIGAPLTNFSCEPAEDHPGWHRWAITDDTRYNGAVIGTVLVRKEDGDKARVRMTPARHHTNSANRIHGGTTLGLCDIAIFAALYMLKGIDAGGSVTIDLSTQFIGAGDPSRPLDAVVEVLRETRRMAFVRGLVVQEEDLVASFSGTARKPSTPR